VNQRIKKNSEVNQRKERKSGVYARIRQRVTAEWTKESKGIAEGMQSGRVNQRVKKKSEVNERNERNSGVYARIRRQRETKE